MLDRLVGRQPKTHLTYLTADRSVDYLIKDSTDRTNDSSASDRRG